jgi:hypothetical protein
MKVTGKIILYTRDGRQLKSRDYFTVNGRRNIVADWKELLEDKNSGCYYQIKPKLLTTKRNKRPIAESKTFKINK